MCPIKEKLYSSLFDELIRQVTIHMPERGLLLMRLRDEIRMSGAAYRGMYMNSVEYSARKARDAESQLHTMARSVRSLERSVDALRAERIEWQMRIDRAQQQNKEIESALVKRRKEEIEYLKAQISQLQDFLASTKSLQ